MKIQTLKILTILLIPAVFLFSALANAKAAFGVKVGTLGIGPEADVEIIDNLNFRLGVNTFRYSRKFSHNNINWHGKLRLFTLAGLFDYHPFGNGLFLAVGPMYNGNKLRISASPTQNITINNAVYTASQLGTLSGEIKFRKIVPYVGVGYDAAFTSTSNFSFMAEVGVLFQGKVRADVSATGLYANNQKALADIKYDVEQATNKSWVRFYPVVALGVKYRF